MRPTHPSHRFSPSGWLAVGLLVVFAAGCANLAAIREFAATSADSAAYTKLVTEYVDSPLRQKRYQPVALHAQLDALAARRTMQRERLLLRHRLIEEYMDALGHLAADDAVVYDKEVNALGKAVTDAKLVGEPDADAFATVSRILLRVVADGWRRRQLSELIHEANPHFQAVVGALRTVVQTGFAADVEIERTALDKYYDGIVGDSRDKAGIAALREWQEQRLATVQARSVAIAAYADILNTISRAHARLDASRNDLSAKAVVADIKGYSRDLRKLFAVVKERL